jgi:hypothetical protein
MDDAIEEALDFRLSTTMTAAEVLAALPDEITVYGYSHQVLNPQRIGEHALDELLEYLDDEYGDPDGGSEEPTDAMRAAAQAFAEAVVKDFVVWACDEVEQRVVDVEAWIRKHRPDWLVDS